MMMRTPEEIRRTFAKLGNVSVAELAKASNKSASVVWTLLNSKHSRVAYDTVESISAGLDQIIAEQEAALRAAAGKDEAK